MPREVVRDGTLHICIEGLYEGQKKRERLDPENLFIAEQMRMQWVPHPVPEARYNNNQWSTLQPMQQGEGAALAEERKSIPFQIRALANY